MIGTKVRANVGEQHRDLVMVAGKLGPNEQLENIEAFLLDHSQPRDRVCNVERVVILRFLRFGWAEGFSECQQRRADIHPLTECRGGAHWLGVLRWRCRGLLLLLLLLQLLWTDWEWGCETRDGLLQLMNLCLLSRDLLKHCALLMLLVSQDLLLLDHPLHCLVNPVERRSCCSALNALVKPCHRRCECLVIGCNPACRCVELCQRGLVVLPSFRKSTLQSAEVLLDVRLAIERQTQSRIVFPERALCHLHAFDTCCEFRHQPRDVGLHDCFCRCQALIDALQLADCLHGVTYDRPHCMDLARQCVIN